MICDRSGGAGRERGLRNGIQTGPVAHRPAAARACRRGGVPDQHRTHGNGSRTERRQRAGRHRGGVGDCSCRWPGRDDRGRGPGRGGRARCRRGGGGRLRRAHGRRRRRHHRPAAAAETRRAGDHRHRRRSAGDRRNLRCGCGEVAGGDGRNPGVPPRRRSRACRRRQRLDAEARSAGRRRLRCRRHHHRRDRRADAHRAQGGAHHRHAAAGRARRGQPDRQRSRRRHHRPLDACARRHADRHPGGSHLHAGQGRRAHR